MDHDKTKEMDDFSRAVKEFREARRMTNEQSPANETDSQAENTYQEEGPENHILNSPRAMSGG